MMPAKAASPAPSAKTMVKSCETRMPTTRAMSGSSTPARIIAPRRVRSSNIHNATATTTAMAMIASRYIGNTAAPTRAKPPSPSGVATDIGSPPQIIRQKSAAMNEMPSVTSTCANWSPGNCRSRKRSITAPSAATVRLASTAASQKFSFTPNRPMTIEPPT